MSVKNRFGQKVGCAGILVEDTFCGPLSQMPPEGMLVALDSMPTKAGGCAANVAIDLVKQGVSVELAGCVGDDSAGRGLVSALEAYGISATRLLVSPTFPTSRTIILLIAGEDRRYIHLFGANAGFAASDLNREWLASLDVFYFGGLFALPAIQVDALTEVFVFCREQGVRTVLDVVIPSGMAAPELSTWAPLLKVTDYFLPNDDEACALTGSECVEDQVTTFLKAGVGTVIITQGERGVVAGRGKEMWRSSSYNEACVDPSGAGDAFTSGVIASILLGRDVPALLRYASAIGTSATQAIGTTDGVIGADAAEAYLTSHTLDVAHRVLT